MEFIVLIPVYILLMTGLFSLSQLVLCRQAVVAAARYEAWTGKDQPDPDVAEAFFPGLSGTYTGAVRKTSGAEFTHTDDLQPKGNEASLFGPGRREQATRIALDVLNNTGGEVPLQQVQCDASFAYTGILVGTRGATVRTKSAVVLMTAHTRKEHEEGKQDHPVNHLPEAPFDPSDDDHRYLSPTEGLTHFGFSMGADAGIWSTRARIDGSPYSEHDYYKGQDKP